MKINGVSEMETKRSRGRAYDVRRNKFYGEIGGTCFASRKLTRYLCSPCSVFNQPVKASTVTIQNDYLRTRVRGERWYSAAMPQRINCNTLNAVIKNEK